MAPVPTVQNGSQNDRPVRPQDRKSDIICRVKYCNTLPDIPFDLKFLNYPFESDRFIQYNPTSLERNYKFDCHTEHDLGVTIDLINRDLYQPDRNATLDAADEKLLEEDTHTPQDTTRSKQHAKSVSWLRKSEYISTEQTRFQPQNMEKAEAKVGYNVKNRLHDETLYMDRDQQIENIEQTFRDSKLDIDKHYTKPNVVPMEVYPVYPDFKNWKFPCAQVIFDADPSPGGKSLPNQIEEMSQAMIRGVMDESGEQFVAYFLPTEDTLEKRRMDFSNEIAYTDETEYEYKMAREYNWNVKSKLSKGYEENYYLVFREDGVYYNELETRVRLSKRRQKLGAQANNTKLIVKHRSLNAGEHKMQVTREKQLEPAGDEEEDEEMEEPEEETKPEVKEETRRPSRSRSGSRATSASHRSSKSRSRSHSGSRSRSEHSRSRSKSAGSRSSKSRSRSRSHSGSPASKRSGSQSSRSSRSHSGSPASRRSNRSGSAASRRSGSHHSRRSGSNHSGSRSRSRSSHSRSSRSHSRSSHSSSESEASPAKELKLT